MNKNEFSEKAKAKDIINLLKDTGSTKLVFEQVDKVTEKEFLDIQRVYSSLDDFILNSKAAVETVYVFEESRVDSFCTVEIMSNDKKSRYRRAYKNSYIPIRTADLKYFLENKSEVNEKRFLKMIKPLCDADVYKNIILTLQEGEISVKNERSTSNDVIKKILKNTYKNLPTNILIRFKPYLLEDNFIVSLDLYLDWKIDQDGFEKVSWSADPNEINQQFFNYLKSNDFKFSVGNGSVMTKDFTQEV